MIDPGLDLSIENAFLSYVRIIILVSDCLVLFSSAASALY
jgi:hypothetical protein